MGIFLTILAIVISSIFIPIGFVYGLIKNLFGINDKSFNIALLIDIAGNVFCAELFNDLLIKADIKPFGNPYQTISEVLGIHNQLLNLTKVGQGLVNLLNYLDPYHVEKVIGMDVPIVHLSAWEQFKRLSIVVFSATIIVFIILYLIILLTYSPT